jgi:aminoglycoside phosphotransferase (APT) family kinase protein
VQPQEILSALGIQTTPTSISRVKGGFDMPMWKIEFPDQTYALRVFGAARQEDYQRERVVMAVALAAGLPVPEVKAAGSWQDYAALLITWLPGRTMADELRAHPWRLWSLGREFGRAQAGIHAVTAPDLVGRQPDAWTAWECQSDPSLQARLLRTSSGQTVLLHLDYHLLNVLTDGRRISGIVDWTNAHAGDPRADAARTVSILRLDPAARKPLIQRLGLRIFEEAWRVGYQRERGQLSDMALFYAWAGTALQQNLANRYRQQPTELAPALRWTNKWKARAGG